MYLRTHFHIYNNMAMRGRMNKFHIALFMTLDIGGLRTFLWEALTYLRESRAILLSSAVDILRFKKI